MRKTKLKSPTTQSQHPPPYTAEPEPYGGFVSLESLTPEQRRTWRYWGTREHRNELPKLYPEESSEILSMLYDINLRIYRTELEKLK